MLLQLRSASRRILGTRAASDGGGLDGFHFDGHVSWFPGHMAKAAEAIERKLRSGRAAPDLIVEVRDARLPLSSANPSLAEAGRGKPRLVVFNKSDLANSNMRARTEACVRAREPGIDMLFASALKQKQSVARVLSWARGAAAELEFSTAVVMILGMPNVGKSTLINQLRRIAAAGGGNGGAGGRRGKPRRSGKAKKGARVGAMPGVTRSLDMLKISDAPPLFMLDTPGVMVPKVPSADAGLKLALLNVAHEKVVGEEVLADYMLHLLHRTKRAGRALELLGAGGGGGGVAAVGADGDEPPTVQALMTNPEALRCCGAAGKQPHDAARIMSTFLLRSLREGRCGLLTLDDVSDGGP